MDDYMDDYIKGQIDLISYIKTEVLNIVDSDIKGDLILIEVVKILKDLKPLDKRFIS